MFRFSTAALPDKCKRSLGTRAGKVPLPISKSVENYKETSFAGSDISELPVTASF